DGGLVRAGVHAELDQLVRIARDGKGAIAAMEAELRDTTGIQKGLRVRHNKVFGSFIEVTLPNLPSVPGHWHRKQTLVNCERFITPELKEFEEKVLGADERRKELEYALFRELRDRVALAVDRLQAVGAGIARVDVVAAFADVAVDRRYVRPVVHDGPELEITGGRHPVVESTPLEDRFVPNDIRLDPQRRLVILTGPNMAGKSTVMRQVALIALMAQCGAFIPADAAQIGCCDRIFVRVGASDDLARGQSTFMVEMSETAAILNQATDRSLILLDEIGRGTSTYDGLSIAWAVAEAVHDRVRARAIFATHYHELVALADDRPAVANLHVAVSEWGERIIFLRTLREGGASKSYGIQCARLAGMPEAVVDRARELLAELERRPRHGPPNKQLDLFVPANAPAAQAERESDPLRQALDGIDPDQLTPRQALDALYGLVAMASEAE
ncbi:MAG: DNA mismatch repair protein MutS, partial [Myxococcota bacterium]|nr:DNA mismatch repair protein MutS [Myxococcota bacterium]